jgi:hypothetical protein
MPKKNPYDSDEDDLADEETGLLKSDSFCTKLDKLFWGDYRNHIYPESRLYANYWFIISVRILLTLVLHIDNIYRVWYTHSEGKFNRYQFYFTTWSLYLTIYSETFIIFTSLYNKLNGFDVRKRWQRNLWKHNVAFFCVAVVCETVVPIMYWPLIYDYRGLAPEQIMRIVDHSIPTIVLIFDFFTVGWLFRPTYISFIVGLFVLYVPLNGIYTSTHTEPLYEFLTWKSVFTLYYLGLIIGICLVSFLIYWLFSSWRYYRYEAQPKSRNKGKS